MRNTLVPKVQPRFNQNISEDNLGDHSMEVDTNECVDNSILDSGGELVSGQRSKQGIL